MVGTMTQEQLYEVAKHYHDDAYNNLSEQEKQAYDEKLCKAILACEDEMADEGGEGNEGEESDEGSEGNEGEDTSDMGDIKKGLMKEYGYENMSDEEKERFDRNFDMVYGVDNAEDSAEKTEDIEGGYEKRL